MKKFYRIFLLLLIFIFLTTYNFSQSNILKNNNKYFFKIRNIEIIGNSIIKKKKIIKKLNDIYGQNIFFIKKGDIVDPLKSINFLEKIEVKKKYPNTIIVKIKETRPLGVLFKDNIKYILDSSSSIIIFEEFLFNKKFPSIFGEGAEFNFINFFNELENSNFPKEKIKNYYYFKIGRWDLQLLDSQIIKFPANKIKEAIQKSIKLLNNDNFKKYNVIDLRIDGKIVVE